MSFRNVLDKSFSLQLVVVGMAIAMVMGLFSAAFFYFYIDRDLGASYTEKFSRLGAYQSETAKDTILIFLAFGVFSAITVSIFGVYYTHKVVGPLVRVRDVSKRMADGNFELQVKFRDTDAIHPLAESLDHFARVYARKYALTREIADSLHKESTELARFIADADVPASEAAAGRISEKAAELSRLLSGIKT